MTHLNLFTDFFSIFFYLIIYYLNDDLIILEHVIIINLSIKSYKLS
jgi:hypothetical protein